MASKKQRRVPATQITTELKGFARNDFERHVLRKFAFLSEVMALFTFTVEHDDGNIVMSGRRSGQRYDNEFMPFIVIERKGESEDLHVSANVYSDPDEDHIGVEWSYRSGRDWSIHYPIPPMKSGTIHATTESRRLRELKRRLKRIAGGRTERLSQAVVEELVQSMTRAALNRTRK